MLCRKPNQFCFCNLQKAMLKRFKFILKKEKKLTTRHHRKRTEKNNDGQFPRIKMLKDEIEKKNNKQKEI